MLFIPDYTTVLSEERVLNEMVFPILGNKMCQKRLNMSEIDHEICVGNIESDLNLCEVGVGLSCRAWTGLHVLNTVAVPLQCIPLQPSTDKQLTAVLSVPGGQWRTICVPRSEDLCHSRGHLTAWL